MAPHDQKRVIDLAATADAIFSGEVTLEKLMRIRVLCSSGDLDDLLTIVMDKLIKSGNDDMKYFVLATFGAATVASKSLDMKK